MTNKICTHCGYEGQAVRPPSDAGGEEEGFLIGFFNKLFFLLTFLPIQWNFVARMFTRGKAKHCPNCGLPLMVRLTSDAGWIAKRKQEIKAGIVVIESTKLAPKSPVTFGKALHIPDPDAPPEPQATPAPKPVALPSLEAMARGETAPILEVEQAAEGGPTAPKKAVDPEAW